MLVTQTRLLQEETILNKNMFSLYKMPRFNIVSRKAFPLVLIFPSLNLYPKTVNCSNFNSMHFSSTTIELRHFLL
jgi:hypothetical protein